MDASRAVVVCYGVKGRSLGFMRRDARKVLVACLLFLTGGVGRAPSQEVPEENPAVGGESVRFTVEVSWGLPAASGDRGEIPKTGEGARHKLDYVLELSQGIVDEAIAWPPRSESGLATARPRDVMGPGPRGSWRLGDEPAGRVRARLEAPLGASVIVRCGDQKISIPVAAILERAQRTPPQAPLAVNIERLAWDSLAIDLGGAASEGIVAPGADLPVTVAYNVLAPDVAEVKLHASAVIRPMNGSDAISHDERDLVVATNHREPPSQTWGIKAPVAEGTYVLEVRANWEASGARESSRIGRLIRRRKPATVASSAVRRVVFAVIDPRSRLASGVPGVPGGSGREARGRETEVDEVDLGRLRNLRLLASGRSMPAAPGRSAWAIPVAALVEPSRRDKLRGWIMRSGAEAARLDPVDRAGIAWSAVGLKVSHPDRPHRVTLKIKGGEPTALGVALLEPVADPAAETPRVLLDACASGPAIAPDGTPATFQWLIWPTSPEMVLVLLNRSADSVVRLGTVTLTELEDVPAGPALHEPRTADLRTLGLYLHGNQALSPFGAELAPRDALAMATNLARYIAYCGASAVVLPEGLTDRAGRRRLGRQMIEDATGPDRLDVIRRVLKREGIAVWLELDLEGPECLPGLPPPESPEAERRGLVRLDGQGHVDGPTYHPLNPEVHDALKRRLTMALGSQAAGAPSAALVTGLVIRLGSGPTLLGTPDTGLDDVTYERFVRETFSPQTAPTIPGIGSSDPDRFAVRSRYLAGVGRMPWLTWRSRAIAALYSDLARTVKAAAPGTVLAVVTPGLDGGAAGAEARRVDRAGLVPSQAWRSIGLDLQSWPSGPDEPLVLRGTALSTDALAHDLATSPDLDTLVAARERRGLLLAIDSDSSPPGSAATSDPVDGTRNSTSSPLNGPPDSPLESTPSAEAGNRKGTSRDSRIWLTALPLGEGAGADEPLGHALAALDAHYVFLSSSAIAGHEDRIRRFATVLRALPTWPSTSFSGQGNSSPRPFGISVRGMSDESQTFLEIANDSPYPIRLGSLLSAPGLTGVDDLGRGLRLTPVATPDGRQLVLDLAPFGVAALRVASPRVQVSSITPFPSEAVRANMQAKFDELTVRLARLNRGLAAVPAEPVNSGFEPDLPAARGAVSPNSADAANVARTGLEPAGAPTLPVGWHIESKNGGGSIAIDREDPHSGLGSIKLTATSTPVSLVSEPFLPSTQSNLMVQTYFRAAADTKVRFWIEGESGGQPYVRRTELSVSQAWEPRLVRASDVPPTGLDSARIRFELVNPGTLWIDDLSILGESSSRSARLQAQRTMLLALKAYQEKRYADFARLAASHWVRQSGTMATGRIARITDPPPAPVGGSARSTETEASALPSDRKLR